MKTKYVAEFQSTSFKIGTQRFGDLMSDDRRQVLVISVSNMLETSHMLKSQNLVGPPSPKLSPLTGLGNIFYLRLSLLGPRI